MKMTTLMFVAIGIALVGSYYLLKKKALESKNPNTLTIGTAAGYAPFVSINTQGEYEGFDIDIMNALAEKMGKKLVIKDLGSMGPLFIALEQGSVDAIIWGLSITKDRLEKVSMVRYQGETTTSYPLIFWKTIPSTITSIDDMKGMTVCVEPATSQDALLSKYPQIVKKPTERIDDALLNIQYGKADAALVEPLIAKKFKTKYPEIQTLEVPLRTEDQVHGIGIAIKKENTALTEHITTAIESLTREGVIKNLENKWNIQ